MSEDEEDALKSEEDEAALKLRERAWAATGPRAFSQAELLRCQTCLRANPPTRAACLYCGAALPSAPSRNVSQPAPASQEKSEHSFNLILAPHATAPLNEGPLNEESLGAAAELLCLGPSELKSILETCEALPLSRTAARDEAFLLENRLKALGLHVLTVSDEELSEKTMTPRRVRALELMDESLLLHPTGGAQPRVLKWSEPVLLLAGRLMKRRVATEERVKRGAGRRESELLNASETYEDEPVLDLYAASGGWRIAANHFDFSCVGPQRSLVASHNFQAVVQILRARAPQAIYDDSYARVRRALALVWRPEQSVEPGDARSGRPGKYSAEVLTSDNETQFTRYALLRYYLLSREAKVNR